MYLHVFTLTGQNVKYHVHIGEKLSSIRQCYVMSNTSAIYFTSAVVTNEIFQIKLNSNIVIEKQ